MEKQESGGTKDGMRVGSCRTRKHGLALGHSGLLGGTEG